MHIDLAAHPADTACDSHEDGAGGLPGMHTGNAAAAGRPNSSSAPPRATLAAQIDALPAELRDQMATAARAATSADAALEPVIALLVSGSPAKRAAIVNAFRTNVPLREQWE